MKLSNSRYIRLSRKISALALASLLAASIGIAPAAYATTTSKQLDSQSPTKLIAADATKNTSTELSTQASSNKLKAIPSTKGKKNIANTKSYATIEADVKLSSKGTGAHAKLVICTATSAVSFGLQYDKCARPPYTGKTMAMIENVKSNNPGDQQYLWPKKMYGKKGKTYRLMLTLNKNGTGSVYVNGTKIGSYKNPNLKNQQVYLRVEGAARKNGDTVNATFKNIKLKNGGKYYPKMKWYTYQFQSNKTIKVTKATGTAVTIKGKISGFPKNADWDTAGYYDKASGIIQFF